MNTPCIVQSGAGRPMACDFSTWLRCYASTRPDASETFTRPFCILLELSSRPSFSGLSFPPNQQGSPRRYGSHHPPSLPNMFIALIGTPSSGKNTIAQYLISRHGFRRIGLADTGADGVDTPRDEVSVDDTVSMLPDSPTHLAETEYSWQP